MEEFTKECKVFLFFTPSSGTIFLFFKGYYTKDTHLLWEWGGEDGEKAVKTQVQVHNVM